ncbi:MAG: ATPase, partial [Pseudoxanthomonas sp.]|nr:ATPase [Pseudoxanthomonas sp.]
MIRSLSVGSERIRYPGQVRLAKGTTALSIDYTAPALSVPDRVRFRYRLDGVDTGWVEAGARRQAFYTNLGPGEYRFRVIAANEDGSWNRVGAQLILSVPPTFVQSWVFKLLCALLILALVWVAYVFRVRAVANRIRLRTVERVRERERIARELHDTLLQSIQLLTLRFQFAVDALPVR